MSSPTRPPDDDSYWQRPDPSTDPLDRPEPETPPYPGPPRAEPPPADWRPPTIAHPPPPRTLPPQDMDALDEAEGSARTVTYGVGLVVGAIALVVVCLLCARVVF
ncbi:translation initiation factor 2 [Actinoplanes hulinensis]|uniref:translation initiation factor 2 n=1 Tax=Actinoplanes hulinensis TaxID=1144547 RepID=UPI001FEB5543|nr:translation initiation factor 2 [Actinoplanes hulinensis]